MISAGFNIADFSSQRSSFLYMLLGRLLPKDLIVKNIK